MRYDTLVSLYTLVHVRKTDKCKIGHERLVFHQQRPLPAYKRPWETQLKMMTMLEMMTMTLKLAGCHAKAKLPRAKSSEKSFRSKTSRNGQIIVLTRNP